MKALTTAILLAVIALSPNACLADEWPSRPIRIFVAFQPGSTPDADARYVAQKLAGVLKQTVIVENKPGAGGVLGADLTAKALPDGYTFGYLSSQHLVHGHLMKHMPYDFHKDLIPVQLIITSPQVVVVKSDLPANTLPEFATWARKQGRSMNYGSGGIGAPAHLAGQAIATALQIPSVHVPYKGAPETMTALLGGHVDYVVTTAGVAIQMIKQGRMKALAVTSATRLPALPEVPTVTQALPNGFVYVPWSLLAAPAGTPAPIVERLNAEVAKIVSEPAARERFIGLGAAIQPMKPVELRAFIQQEQQHTDAWVKAAQIQPE